MTEALKHQRRPLKIDRLIDVMPEVRRLATNGYACNGNWTLGQICRHLSVSLDLSVDGYPRWMSLFAPIRPVLRHWMLPRLLRHESPSGVRTTSSMIPPNDLNDEVEIDRLEKAIRRIEEHKGGFYPHPGFGKLQGETFDRFHAAHAAHHLSFLEDSHPLDCSP